MKTTMTRAMLPLIAIAALSGVDIKTQCNDEVHWVGIQKSLDHISFDHFDLNVLTDSFGDAEIKYVGELIEGFRDGKLEALCTKSYLAENRVDRSLELRGIRREYFHSYPTLGLAFRILDNPWTLYEVHLSSSNLTLNHLRPGQSMSVAWEMFDSAPKPGRKEVENECSWEWNSTSAYAPCPVEGEDTTIRRVVVRNPGLPSQCWLSFRGMYE